MGRPSLSPLSELPMDSIKPAANNGEVIFQLDEKFYWIDHVEMFELSP